MPNPIAVILRFNGDPDDLLARFEQALNSWTEAQGDDRKPPTFFAICTREEGIVLVTAWQDEDDHKAFRKQMMPRLHAAGVARPEIHEQLRIARIG